MTLVLATSRAWVWPVLFSSVAGLYLFGRVAARGLTAEARAAYRTAWHRSWRPMTTTGVAFAWTLVYALYALSLPTPGPLVRITVPELALPAPSASETAPAPAASPPSFRPNAPGGVDRPVAPPELVTAPPVTFPLVIPPARPVPPAVVCSAEAAGDSVRQAQVAAEQLTGRHLGADLSLVVEALAGCGDAENAALSLLGPINQLLNDLGVPILHLPPSPDLPVPPVPEAIAAPLRPAVFEACGQLMPQLLTVAAVAPVARISAEDALRVLRYVSSVCRAFAPEAA